MVEVAVEVLLPGIETVTEGHFRIVLERLPLCTLLPIGAAALSVGAKAVAEATVHTVAGLLTFARQQFVARYLILERVADLMGNY